MNTILLLDQHALDPSVDNSHRSGYLEREAARAVLFDDDGRVALMHANNRGYYKLPGGGIDEGEDVLDALSRELLEETGYSARVIQEIGMVEEWRDGDRLHQISYAFTAVKVGDPVEQRLTGSEVDEGFEMIWVSNLQEALHLVEATVHDADIRVSFMTRRDAAILRAAAS